MKILHFATAKVSFALLMELIPFGSFTLTVSQCQNVTFASNWRPIWTEVCKASNSMKGTRKRLVLLLGDSSLLTWDSFIHFWVDSPLPFSCLHFLKLPSFCQVNGYGFDAVAKIVCDWCGGVGFPRISRLLGWCIASSSRCTTCNFLLLFELWTFF